jgi:hypothetical protein
MDGRDLAEVSEGGCRRSPSSRTPPRRRGGRAGPGRRRVAVRGQVPRVGGVLARDYGHHRARPRRSREAGVALVPPTSRRYPDLDGHRRRPTPLDDVVVARPRRGHLPVRPPGLERGTRRIRRRGSDCVAGCRARVVP